MPEGLTLNGLSLNNGTTHILTELQLPIPAKKPEWIEGADANGAVLMRDPLVENGTLVCKLDLYTASKDAANAAIGAIVDELEEADRNPTGVPVVWTPVNGTKSLTFYALSGEVTELPMDTKAVDSNVPTIQVTLKCRPGGYGALVTGPSQTTAGPVVQLTVPDVPGDMPTDEAYIVITDQSSQSRRHVEWGAEWLHYNAATSLVLDSDSLVTSGYAGTGTTFGGSYDPNGTGSNAIVAVLFQSPIALVGTGSQAHVGTFRVKLRGFISPITATGYFRLTWKAGDGLYRHNDWVAPTVPGQYCEMDLGLITVPPAEAGTQSWEARVEAYSPDAPTTASAAVDYLLLVPVESGYGVARGDTTLPAGVVTAYDLFNQAASALNAIAAPAGGSWATTGATTDFQLTGTGTVTRASPGTDVLPGGRYATLGTSTYTNVQATMKMSGFNAAAYERGLHGLVLRYTDTSLYAAAWLNPSQSTVNFNGTSIRASTLQLVVCTGGVHYVIAYDPAVPSGLPILAAGWAVNLTASISSAGEFTATMDVPGWGTRSLTGYSPELATGGLLASGKAGFSSGRSGAAVTYTFDEFTVSTLPVLAPAIHSGRTLEVTGASVRRQSSTGTLYGTPGSYRGSRFILNPEGSAGRTTRIAAKAHRNDIAAGTAIPVTDSLKLQVFYRPRYSVVPR